MKKLLILLIFFPIFSFVKAQVTNPNPENGLVKWMSFKESQEANKKQSRPFIIDIYTDWCGWCKHMMKTTYSNPFLADYINNNFYPVKFNAETRDTVEFMGEKYINKGNAQRSTNDLAIKLLNGKLSYPTTLFMNSSFKFNLSAAGYLDIPKIEPLLVFTLENVYMTTQVEEFQKRYKQSFYDTASVKKFQVKWISINEALMMNNVKPRKLLINLYSDYCNSCRVMYRTTFTDSSVATYLNNNFYMVNFNIVSKDTIKFNGNVFTNKNGINEFSYALTGNNLYLPSISVLNEENKLITNIPYYITPENMLPIINYFGQDSYLKIKWEDYLKNYNNSRNSKP